MKKLLNLVILVLVIGFLTVSCGGGGGNIKKVQNGVFSSYDNTITVGKALENNSTLKGGKWEALEMDGRDYVTYTVRLTGEQVQAILLKSFSSNSFYANKPNYGTAMEFYENALILWFNNVRNATVLARLTSMSAEEVNQARDIFKAELDSYNESPERSDFFDYSGILDRNRSGQIIKVNDDFIDPYLLTITPVLVDITPRGRNTFSIYRSDLDDRYCDIITYSIRGSDTPLLEIEDGNLIGSAKRRFDYRLGDTDYADNTDLLNAIVRTRTKFYNWYVEYHLKYENAMAEWRERRNNDIAPLLTIDAYEVTLSFIMNQDDTFATNMMEGYTEVTLNCLDNLKVRYNAGNSESVQIILSCIYRGFTPDFF